MTLGASASRRNLVHAPIEKALYLRLAVMLLPVDRAAIMPFFANCLQVFAIKRIFGGMNVSGRKAISDNKRANQIASFFAWRCCSSLP